METPLSTAVTEATDFLLWEAEMGQGGTIASLFIALQETVSGTLATAGSSAGFAVMAVAIAGFVVAALLFCLVNDVCKESFLEAIGVIRANRSMSFEGKTLPMLMLHATRLRWS